MTPGGYRPGHPPDAQLAALDAASGGAVFECLRRFRESHLGDPRNPVPNALSDD
jgi:hypothetical protein